MKRGSCRAGVIPAFAGIVAAMFFVLAHGSVGAQDIFVVEDVSVDATAETPAAARQRAIEEATRKAFDRLAERLVFEPGFGPAPRISDAMVQNLVEGIEIANEKASAVRYLADITVRFRPDAVRSLYGQDGRRAYGGPALLVVPIYELADTRVIWEEFNPWWVAWEQRLGNARRTRLALPEGGPMDVNALTARQAATGDRDRLLALADRYAADGVLVARAALDRSGPAPALNLVVTGFGRVPGTMGLVDRVQGMPGETVDEVARRGVSEVLAMIDDVARRQSEGMAERGPGIGNASTIVIARLNSPADLAALRRNLRSVVTREELVSLSRGRATLRLFHSGSREMLRNALSRNGIVVTDTPEGWSLSLPGSPGISPTPLSPVLSGGR